MKIAIDARFYGPENGGLGRYTINLLDQLQKLDHKNSYSVLLRSPWFEKLKMRENFKAVEVGARHYSVKEQVEIPRILRDIKPDITHFLHFNVPVFYKGSFIVTIHDLLMHQGIGTAATTLPSWKYHIKRLGYRHVFDHAISGAKDVIVPSNFVKGELQKAYPRYTKKVSVIYEGVSYLSGEAITKKREEVPYFLYVGNAYPHKNISSAIKALVELNAIKKNPARLVLVTPRDVFTTRLEEEIKNVHAEQFVTVRSLVSDTELFDLYRNAQAFVYPSFSEGFGLQGLEAMHSQTRLLASDIPVFHELYGNHALYFNPHDVTSIAKAFEKTLVESTQKRKDELVSAQQFSRSYSWEQMARDTLALYAQA